MRLKLIFFSACVVPLWFVAGAQTRAYAQVAPLAVTVIETGEASGEHFTSAQLRAKALDDARRKAIEKVVGVAVSSETFVQNFQMGGDFIQSVSYGRIVSEDVIKEEPAFIKLDSKEPPVPVYRVTIRAAVAKEQGQRDPAFTVKVELDRKAGVYQDGEAMRLKIRSAQDCYVTVLDIYEDGQVSVLLPNRFHPGRQVRAGDLLEFPSDEEIGRGIRITLQVPPGRAKTTETIKVIATKGPIDLVDGAFQDALFQPVRDKSGMLTDLARRLVNVPLSERAEATAQYQIVAKHEPD